MPLASSREFASRHTVFEWKADLRDAIRDADIVYTDTWVSMGSEHEAEEREEAFKGFNINRTNTALASPHHVFMHDLPAHPGKEVDADVLRGQHSVVFRQAQNRKHAQKALMRFILEG
jgi:ornithine carbamoyltransferase